MMRLLKKLVYSIDEIIAALVLAFIILLAVSGVFFRYILQQPIAWQEELLTAAMVWLVFMGGSVVAKKSAHIRIDSLCKLLPQKYQQIWLLSVNALMFLVLGLLFFFSAQLAWQTQKLTTILKIPYGLVYMAAPITTLMMMTYTARDVGRLMRDCRSAD
jgi:TRAP-type C4-dicarboxylate transport system permease small subunit